MENVLNIYREQNQTIDLTFIHHRHHIGMCCKEDGLINFAYVVQLLKGCI